MPSEKAGKEKNKDKAKTHKLSLKGSSKLVAEFFEYSINSILYQRAVYPPEDFTPIKKYGLTLLVTSDDQIKSYIKRIMSQLNKWMVNGKISSLVIVITSKATGEHVERWQFDVDISFASPPSAHSTSGSSSRKTKADGQENAATTAAAKPEAKTETQIQAEIQSLFRQITASVTFLPQLTEPCTFNVLVYAAADSDVPLEWGDSDAKDVVGGEKVQLRNWGTGLHGVRSAVVYKLGE